MNWSKGLTVKEKIMVHLIQFNQYSTLDDVPESVTQQGIADIIVAPRPHVSMALKDLKSQNLISESTRHIKSGKRKQKVYFLTGNGIRFTKDINQRLSETKLFVKTSHGQTKKRLHSAAKEHDLTIFEIFANIGADGVLDLTKYEHKQRPVPRSKPKERRIPDTAEHVGKEGKETLIKATAEKDQIRADIPQSAWPEHSFELTRLTQQNPDQYPYAGYEHGYDKYYYPDQDTLEISEKASGALFLIGYFMVILGGLVGIYFFTINDAIFIIPMILFFTFGISGLTFGATALWSIEKWQKRILNLLIVTIPIEFYLLFYSAQSSELSLSDLGVWLVIIITFLIIAYFGTFIPKANRIQLLCILGVILILNAPLAFFLVAMEIYQTGFWVVVGTLCGYIGYTLVDEDNKIENMYTGLLYGFGFGIIFSVGIFILRSDLQGLTGLENMLYGILCFWCLLSVLLIHQAYTIKGSQIIKIMTSFKLALPAFIGILLLFFGLYLIRLEKVIESLIELFIGAVLILYSGKQLKGRRVNDLVFIALIMGCFFLTLGYLLL